MSRRTDDYARSTRLMHSAIDYGESSDSDKGFAGLIVNALLEQGDREDRGQYPPAGHDYPRKR